MIELLNVGMVYDDVRVLSGVTHTFAPASATAITGASGSGKTTLLRIMLGLEVPSEGTVRGVPERVGAVFQEDRLIEHYDARENVRLVCGRDVPDSLVDAQLAEVGIADVTGKRVREFSGGMRRRVALVRALIARPELIVLDEPFKGLDQDSKEQAAAYVTRMRGDATLIVVTHDLSEAQLLGAGDVLRIDARP